MSTCNRLDLQTLGCQPVMMPKNLHDHWFRHPTRNEWFAQIEWYGTTPFKVFNVTMWSYTEQ